MIQKRQLFFQSLSRFLLKKIAANDDNTSYITGSLDAQPQSGEPDVMWQSVVFIADTHQIWTNGTLFGSGNITVPSAERHFEVDEDGCLIQIKTGADDGTSFEIDADGNFIQIIN